MSKELEINECIRRMAGIKDNLFKICTAKNISETDYSCDADPVDGSALITGVRLVSKTESHESTVVIPEDDSLILVAMLSNTDAYMMHADKAKKVLLKVGNTTIEITDGLIKMNGGNNNGLVLVDKMVTWMNKVYSDLITLQGLLSASLVAGNGLALGISFIPQTPAPSSQDFANTKIKQ